MPRIPRDAATGEGRRFFAEKWLAILDEFRNFLVDPSNLKI